MTTLKPTEEPFLSEEGKILAQAIDALQSVINQNVRLKKMLCELDTGGGDYLTSRSDIAKLSGIPAMAISWDEHINIIKEKLENKESK